MPAATSSLQLIWGVLLVAAGIGVIIRIPQVMPRIREIEYFAAVIPFITFCFYFMAAILIGGGTRKIFRHFRPRPPADPS